MEIVLGIPFFFFSIINIKFTRLEKLIQKFYIIAKALFTIIQVKFIDKREFTKTILNKNSEIFTVYITTLKATGIANIIIYLLQIVQIAVLQFDKTSTKIPAKYTNYTNIFLFDLAIELSENISINKHAITLVKDKQQLYGSIYTFNLMELEILKTYIEIQLKTRFI